MSGAVWVAHGLTGQVSRVDPQLGGIASFDVARTQQRSADGAVAPGSESVWAVFSDATLARIDPRSNNVETTFAGSRPAALAEGGGGLWVVSSGDSTVYRFNPATFRSGPIGRASVGRRSTGVAYGHGAVWVTSSGDDVVTRIDPGVRARGIRSRSERSPSPSPSTNRRCGLRTPATAPSPASTRSRSTSSKRSRSAG